MCGVFGYVGQRCDVGGAVIAALKALEYRGYDSWGVAVATANGLVVDKDVGRINGRTRDYPESRMGLGHTRWATHGGVTRQNAHPHTDCSQRVAVVHNGIIENHDALRNALVGRGHHFASETDSEIVAHLVEERLASHESLAEAVADILRIIRGYNAIVVMDTHAGELVAAKRTSPLIVGQSPNACTIASDAFALQNHADHLIHLEDEQVAVLTAESATVLNAATLRPASAITYSPVGARDDAALGSYPDFLSKEVAEQPQVLRRITQNTQDIAALAAEIRAAPRVVLVGCGSAGNAALAGTYLLSEISGLDATFVPASEYRYRARSFGPNALVVALSQSGETIDVLEAMEIAKRHGSRLAAIVNTPRSTLERMVDSSVLLGAGIEQCVLATKSYTAMLATLLLTSFALDGRWDAGVAAVAMAADAIHDLLHPRSRQNMIEIGSSLSKMNHLFVIGRGIHYPSALEAALKIKEVSYVHAEGFAAGELKHGVIALIEPGSPCLVFAPDDQTRVDVLSSASELRSRGGQIIGVGSREDSVFDEFIRTPDAGVASPLVEAIPGQFLGYAAALAGGHDPDRPRNLAKSVTVK